MANKTLNISPQKAHHLISRAEQLVISVEGIVANANPQKLPEILPPLLEELYGAITDAQFHTQWLAMGLTGLGHAGDPGGPGPAKAELAQMILASSEHSESQN